jgi:hypothetical protein
MEKQTNFFLSIPAVALGTALLLTIPLIGMQVSDGWDWSPADFIIMGALIFGTGTLFVLAMRMGDNLAYRAGMVLAIGTTFLLIWVNLAVGLIGSGPNPANLMYVGVIAVLLIGVYLSRFNAAGLDRAMFATAFSMALLGIIAILLKVQNHTDTTILEIIGINLFFATPFVIAGLLFRSVALKKPSVN